MYPRTLDPDDVKSKAEARLHKLCADQLDDGWHCFHSAGWVHRNNEKGLGDGEIDFVLAHPERGIICLEVKGGALQCNHGKWERKEKGKWVQARDPFAQATDHVHDLKRLIGKRDGFKHHKLLLARAVATPDVLGPSLELGPDAPSELLIDSKGVCEMPTALDRVVAHHKGAKETRKPPGPEGIDMLVGLLAPDVTLVPTIGAGIPGTEHELVTLTHEQSAVLNGLAEVPRVCIRGCAGSGKTMIAIEHAKRLAGQGKRVAYVCFNRALREHLRAHNPKIEGLSIHNFHAMCVAMGKRADVDIPEYPNGEAPQKYWDDELPDVLMDAAGKLGDQFDALMIDEAQDFANHWLDALASTLPDPDTGQIWLFMDPNQAVYGARLEEPHGFVPYNLQYNCRNTRQIAHEVHKKYEGDPKPRPLGPDGPEVRLLQTADQPATVAAELARLTGPEQVAPQDVVVLSAHGFDKSAVAAAGAGNDLTFARDFAPLGPKVRLSSIRGFKGLESPVVILCELEDTDEETRDQQLYVGLSRAKSHCVIVAPG